MKRAFSYLFLMFFYVGCLSAQNSKQTISDLFREYIGCQKANFSMLPRDANKLLVTEGRYAVQVDNKNYFIHIVDKTMADGDGCIQSDFTYFGIKNTKGIIAITREVFGGDEGGVGDGSNTLSFFSFNRTWNECTAKILVMPQLSVFASANIPAQYNSCKYFTVLPQQGTDLMVFAVPDPKFRVYSNSPDDPFSYSLDKQYFAFFSKRSFLAIVYKWNSATGQFIEKERIANTKVNQTKYKTYLSREN